MQSKLNSLLIYEQDRFKPTENTKEGFSWQTHPQRLSLETYGWPKEAAYLIIPLLVESVFRLDGLVEKMEGFLFECTAT